MAKAGAEVLVGTDARDAMGGEQRVLCAQVPAIPKGSQITGIPTELC